MRSAQRAPPGDGRVLVFTMGAGAPAASILGGSSVRQSGLGRLGLANAARADRTFPRASDPEAIRAHLLGG